MDKKSRELVMAKLYFKNKAYNMAEKSFNEYLELNPTDANATKLLAQVYEQTKRFDKAFEMYERCYLAEPDRTGVLLDICRILLMNEIWLEHVDYRKWLNLAIKAFPSNPIVVNLKACLATLPPGDHKSVSNEEDPLERIFEKLCSMESRLEKIEDKLKHYGSKSDFPPNNAHQNATSPPPQTEPPKAPAPQLTAPKCGLNPPKFNPQFEPPKFESPKAGPPKFETPKFEAPKFDPPKFDLPKFDSPKFESPKFDLPKFDSLKLDQPKLNSSIPDQPKLNSSSLDQPKSDLSKVEQPKSLFGSSIATGFSFSSLNPTESVQKSVSSPSSGFNFSTNLFENSLQKFNLPKEGSWANNSNTSFSFSKPQEEEKPNEEAEEEELAPNEELAIENTCDMEPVEIKTGEENEDLLFEHRCKLFRFRDKEYKERGLGSIKVLKHKTTGKGRLIMRREAIGLVCLNCWDCNKVERVRETQVRWIGLDASDGDPEPTVFLVKFKTKELTDTFMSHLVALFPEDGSPNTSVSSQKDDKTPTSTNDNDKPDVELVDPKLNPFLVDKARQLQLPDLFYHTLKNQEPCTGCDGCNE